ncbi:MAG: hypothetical protein O6761_07985, partial [Thaumarchaeota archaeon]|nr:hypothetical protein [Nitrososphaerota archaeon]
MKIQYKIIFVFFVFFFGLILGSTVEAVEFELRERGNLVVTSDPKGDPFELGVTAIPVLTANLAVLAAVLLYRNKRMSIRLSKVISVYSGLEISPRVTLIIILSILSIYIAFSVEELTQGQEGLGDYQTMMRYQESFKQGDIWD